MNLAPILENKPIHTSVPCRIDFGGTLDISTFYLALARLKPATLNIALDMRTHVYLSPWKEGRIKISSKGFDTLERSGDEKGWDTPLGFMAAVLQYFDVHGLHLHIESHSPPRSALGGSSSAAVAVIAAICTALEKPVEPGHIAWLAHYLEGAVAGVLCGVQDQTAAAFGGVHLWEWIFEDKNPGFLRSQVFEDPKQLADLNSHLLVAYCGIPHESQDINSRWVNHFKSGKVVGEFEQIATITRQFSTALTHSDYAMAAELMNQETAIRCEMTPDVLDNTGYMLWTTAKALNCGARFTGAGGGGCLWAIGETGPISALKDQWQSILGAVVGGRVLDTAVDPLGIVIHE